VAAPRPASGAWHVAGQRLGDPGGPGDQFRALVLLDQDGTLTFSIDDDPQSRGIGGWRSAGAGRVVAHAELFVRRPSGREANRVVVQAAAELSPDGTSASVRLRWRLVRRDGGAATVAVGCEAVAELLRP
jgi:hypothetical protein